MAWTTAARQVHLTRVGGDAATSRHALATGFDRAFLVAAGAALTILIPAVVLIWVSTEDGRTLAFGEFRPTCADQGNPLSF